jgi:hypothetical protein
VYFYVFYDCFHICKDLTEGEINKLRTPRTILLDQSVEDCKGMGRDEENNMKRNMGKNY